MAFRGDLDALILGVLNTSQMHGYEISKRINEGAEQAIRVKEAQLYPILHRLENDGKIEAEWLPQEGKPARKVYRLTEAGRQALAAKREDWQKFVLSVSALMGTKAEVSRG
jgi:PadR family transcriptional regulator PadR